MSLIKQPYEVSSELFLKALIYGQPGIGKSTLALSMPNPILIDCDNGIHRISPSHRVPYLPVNSYAEVLEVLTGSDVAGFDTIVIDTAGKLLDYISQWIIKNDPKKGRKDGALTLQGYGVRKYEFVRLLKMVMTMGKHLVFVAHETKTRNGDDIMIEPEVGGSSLADLSKELDIMGYMEAMNRQRTISFSPSDRYYAKNSAKLEDVIQIPDLKNGTVNNYMTGIVEKCRQALAEESEQVGVYNGIMQKIESGIKAVTTVESANDMFATFGKQAHLWDSKARAWGMLQVKAAGLGLTYDKDSKKFLPPDTGEPKEYRYMCLECDSEFNDPIDNKCPNCESENTFLDRQAANNG